MTKLIPNEQAVAEHMRDPEYARLAQESELAHQVALRVLTYRTEHGLSQTALARLLGMRQPHVARLEAGEHTPSLATLTRLARVLGLEFNLHISQDRGLELSA
jgi:ribosome-binding protein aMBF1 (putative translation factor)